MHILVANDDGFRAPGLAALVDALAALGRCSVIAPDRDRSGASSSLTLRQPLRAHRQDNGFIAVEGTPTDCVHLGINGLLDSAPEMVVSGINAGSNMGDDVHYSGTVAAAMEGRFLGLPAFAFSLAGDSPQHYATAGRVARQLLGCLDEVPLPGDVVYNINVPDRPFEALAGWRSTRLGNRHKSEPVIVSHDPRGCPCYWIGPPGPEQDAGPGTDFDAVTRGYVSITPLASDMTRHDTLADLEAWMTRCLPA
jgi:5'-nucleotidase